MVIFSLDFLSFFVAFRDLVHDMDAIHDLCCAVSRALLIFSKKFPDALSN